jgi:hypothetical protein
MSLYDTYEMNGSTFFLSLFAATTTSLLNLPSWMATAHDDWLIVSEVFMISLVGQAGSVLRRFR